MHAATPATETPGLESAIHGDAAQHAPRPAERRHGGEYLASRGIDYPLALFWGGYLAVCTGALAAWLWAVN